MSNRNLTRLAPAIAALIAVCGWASPSLAAPVTFSFAGTVTQTNADPDDPFAGSIAFGTLFSGSYTFDSTSADGIAGPDLGSFTSSGGPFGFAVNIGGHDFATSDFLNIGVFNDALDVYTVLACAGSSACGDLAMELFFESVAGLLLSSDALPLDAPLFSALDLAAFGLRGLFDGNQVEIRGQVTSLTCTVGCVPTTDPGPGPEPVPVPEPSTMLLCLTGLGTLVGRRLRFLPFVPAHMSDSRSAGR